VQRIGVLLCVASAFITLAAHGGEPSWLTDGTFKWKSSGVLQSPAEREDRCVSVKDPSIVHHNGRWHLFTTIRSEKRTHQIEYSSFADWKDAATAPRHLLTFNPGYFCAPQVFYFTPHKKWYLLHQAADKSRRIPQQPTISTTETIEDPTSWSAPQFLYDEHPANINVWLDFWIICDAKKAHLFFTSLNGQMLRAETSIDQFPKGWTQPEVVLRGDIFEASHTYKLKERDQYLTIIEAQAGPCRYFKAYIADKLDGVWKPLADTREKPFAGSANVTFDGNLWAESISHGELLRCGSDERLEIDPAHLQFLYQGVKEVDVKGKQYGKIPWRLGLLELSQP